MKSKLQLFISFAFFFSQSSPALELIGQVQSKDRYHAVAEISGVVESIDLQVGDSVYPDKIIAQIKQQDFKLEVDKRHSNVALAQADLLLKEAIYKRYQDLINDNNLSENELDIAKADFLSAKANLAIAQVELENAQIELAQTQISSPISGFVVDKLVEQGAWINQGERLYTLVNIDTVTILLYASEHDLAELKNGQRIEIWPETAPHQRTIATISRIGVEMDKTLHAYPVEVEFSNYDLALKPGMSVYATTSVSASNIAE